MCHVLFSSLKEKKRGGCDSEGTAGGPYRTDPCVVFPLLLTMLASPLILAQALVVQTLRFVRRPVTSSVLLVVHEAQKMGRMLPSLGTVRVGLAVLVMVDHLISGDGCFHTRKAAGGSQGLIVSCNIGCHHHRVSWDRHCMHRRPWRCYVVFPNRRQLVRNHDATGGQVDTMALSVTQQGCVPLQLTVQPHSLQPAQAARCGSRTKSGRIRGPSLSIVDGCHVQERSPQFCRLGDLLICSSLVVQLGKSDSHAPNYSRDATDSHGNVEKNSSQDDQER